MNNISSIIQNTISISMFNRGLAGKIFNLVKKTGAKVVMKNNTPECVLLSPEEYIKMMDEVNDARLLALATKRMENSNITEAVPAADVYRELGISTDDSDNLDQVEFE